MLMNDSYGMFPGLTTARETYEAEFMWGDQKQAVIMGGLISGAARDSGNSPTTELRKGLLLGQILSTGLWTTYSPTATDGSEVAGGVLMESFRTQDFEGNNKNIFYGILVGGPVQASKILNLDGMARPQMRKFMFDDIGNVQGNSYFDWKRFQTKTSNYTIVASDNFTLFDNTGAGAQVVLTLPAIAPGYKFGAQLSAAQVLRFTSAEGGNLIGTSLTQTSASATAIGGLIVVYSNPAGTKWIVEQRGTQTITFA